MIRSNEPEEGLGLSGSPFIDEKLSLENNPLTLQSPQVTWAS